MNQNIQPGEEFTPPPLAAQSFFCCCPIVLPLLPFFALRWMVVKASEKLSGQ